MTAIAALLTIIDPDTVTRSEWTALTYHPAPASVAVRPTREAPPDAPGGARVGWRTRAACRGLDPDLFFPEQGSDARAAKAVCAACPVRAECLEEHLDERTGVWGGTSVLERRNLRHARGRDTPRSWS